MNQGDNYCMNKITIDGPESIELMTEEQREEYVKTKYNMTWNEFVKKAIESENEPLIRPGTKYLN